MAINIQDLINLNPSTITDKCKCNTPEPCWLSSTQEDGSGLNPDGTTNGTGQTFDNLVDNDSNINYSGVTLLKVYHKEGTQSTYCIEFPAIKYEDSFLTPYKLYGSPSPIQPKVLIENWYPSDKQCSCNKNNNRFTIEYDVEVPFTSREIDWHFWVEAPVVNGKGGLISLTGASVWTSERNWSIPTNQQISMPISYPTNADGTVLDNSYLDFILQKNRADKMMVLQADGEPFDIYLRRWEGTPCPLSDNRGSGDVLNASQADLNYNSHTNCPYCFGTGFVGGYYKKIRIFARYNANPSRIIKHTAQGIQTTQQLQSWTLWTPPLRAYDLIVQCSTGDRFYVQDVSRTIVRSYIMDQQFNNAMCQRSEIVYTVTDKSIMDAFKKYNDDGYNATTNAFKPTDTIWG